MVLACVGPLLLTASALRAARLLRILDVRFSSGTPLTRTLYVEPAPAAVKGPSDASHSFLYTDNVAFRYQAACAEWYQGRL